MGALLKPLPTRDTDSALRQLGLTLADAEWVMARILNAGRGMSAYALPSKAGTYRYHEGVEALRERAIPAGFTVSDEHNIGRIIAPDGSFQIILGQGNEHTGTEVMPSTKRRRGPKGQELVLPSLFPPEQMRSLTHIRQDLGVPTRVFLFFATTEFVRAELSVPIDLDRRGRYSKFAERIPLGEYPGPQVAGDRPAVVTAANLINVPVTRRKRP